MDRQTLTAEDEAWIAERRAYHRGEADAGADDAYDPKDRRNRQHVLGPRCRVKEGDDVLISDTPYRVICPARDEGFFYAAMQAPWGAWLDGPMPGVDITDRAPADPNEEPLPLFIDDAADNVDPEPP